MLSFTTLLLACPQTLTHAQQPLSWFPEQTAAVVEINPQVWNEYGETTYAHQMFDLPAWEKFMPPIQGLLEEMEHDPEFVIMSTLFDYWGKYSIRAGIPSNFLDDSRFWINIKFADTETAKVIESLFTGTSKKEIEGGRLYTDRINGTWFFKDNFATAVIREYVDDENLALSQAAKDAAFLINRLYTLNGDISFADRPEVATLQGHLATQSDFLGIWVSSDLGSVAGVSEFLQEEIPEEVDAFLEAVGLYKFRSFAWTIAIEPPYLVDRLLAYGPGLGEDLFPADLLAENNLVEMVSANSSDSSVVSVNTIDFVAMFDMFFEAYEAMNKLSALPTLEAEILQTLAEARVALGGLGPTIHTQMLAEDMWNGGNGSIWISVSDKSLVEAGLDLLPDDLRNMMAMGMIINPAGERANLKLEDNRLLLLTGTKAEAEGVLAETIPWQEQALWLEQLQLGNNVSRVDWFGPEVIANAFEIVREMDELNDELSVYGIDLEDLPDFNQVINATCGLATVHQVKADGYFIEARSPLGMILTSMFAGVAQLSGILAESDEEMF